MAADIHQTIAALNPDWFCEVSVRREVKRILREGKIYGDNTFFLKAAEKAQPVEANAFPIEDLEQMNPFKLPAFKSPIERHALIYDSFDDSPESFYFWLLDDLTAEGWQVSKLTDTFLASPGSGLFGDLARHQAQAQRQALQLLRQAHTLVQDILRAAAAFKSEDQHQRELPLPSIRSRSEADLGLLRSKIETLKLCAHWLGPYLKQLRQMDQHTNHQADWPNLFNTAVMEIILLAERQYSVGEDVDQGLLPKFVLKAPRRTCNPILVIELKIRAAPERTPGGAYGYRGRFELAVTSYALTEEELAVLRQEVERDDLREVIGAVAGKAAGALSEIVEQIENLVPQPPKEELEPDDPNPFTALFDFKKSNTPRDPDSGTISISASPRPIRSDSDIEKVIRSQAILDARRRCLDFYTRCKQALKMVTF